MATPVFYIDNGTFYLNGEMEVSQVVGEPCVITQKPLGQDLHVSANSSKRTVQIMVDTSIYGDYNVDPEYTLHFYVNGVDQANAGEWLQWVYEIPANTAVTFNTNVSLHGSSHYANGAAKNVTYMIMREDNNTPIT